MRTEGTLREIGSLLDRAATNPLVGLGLAMLLAAPVAADTEPTEFRRFERGHLASAGGAECHESADGRRVFCTRTDVNIFDGRRGGSEPEFRFAGEEVCVSRVKSTFKLKSPGNPRTGYLLSDTSEQGCARNRRSLDVDFGERLRWASVAGTIKLQRERCTYSGEESCERESVSGDVPTSPGSEGSPPPPPRLMGTFRVRLTVTESDNVQPPAGESFTRDWLLTPQCEEGGCDTDLRRELFFQGEFTDYVLVVALPDDSTPPDTSTLPFTPSPDSGLLFGGLLATLGLALFSVLRFSRARVR